MAKSPVSRSSFAERLRADHPEAYRVLITSRRNLQTGLIHTRKFFASAWRRCFAVWHRIGNRLLTVWRCWTNSTLSPTSRIMQTPRLLVRGDASPIWLSQATPTIRDIRYQRTRAVSHGMAVWFHHLLYLCHSIERASVIGAVVLFGLVGGSLIYGVQLNHVGAAAWLDRLASTLLGVAGVIAGAAGILFALIVFGIQIHAGRLGRAAFLVHYIRRSEGLLPIAAFTLALIGANTVTPLIAQLGFPHAVLPLALADILLVPLALGLVLRMLYRMATTVSADFYDEIRPSMIWEYDRALDEDIYHAMQLQVFDDLAQKAGIRYSSVAGWIDGDRGSTMKFRLTRPGEVAGIHIPSLNKLSEYIKAKCPDYDASLSIGPGDTIDDSAALILAANRDGHGPQKSETDPPSDAVRAELNGMLQRVYRIRGARERDLPSILNRFEVVIFGQAKDGAADDLKRGLELQEALIARSIRRSDTTHSTASLRRKHLPDFLGSFTYFDMAANAVASGDHDTVEVLFSFACRGMITGIEAGNPNVYYRFGQIIEAIYHRATTKADLAGFVGSKIDSWFATLGPQLKYTSPSPDLDANCVADQMPIVQIDLGWRLRLIRAAIEAGRETDASNFQDRIFRWDRHLGRRFAGLGGRDNTPVPIRDACDMATYAVIVVAGWCLHLIESEHEHSDTAIAVFHKCASTLRSRHDILRAWENICGQAGGSGRLGDFLDVSHWIIPPPTRIGVSEGGHFSDTWIDRGYLALLICRPDARRHEISAALKQPPAARPRDSDQIKTEGASILANEAIRADVLQLSEADGAKALEAVTAMFAERLRLFKLARLQKVVAAPVDNKKLEALKLEITSRLPDKQRVNHMLCKIGVSKGASVAWLFPRIQFAAQVWKTSLISGRDGQTGFGEILGESLADREDMRLFHIVELSATPFRTASSLHGLSETVRAARDVLVDSSYRPNVVLLPRPRRFLRPFTERWPWELQGHRSQGDFHIGDWDGLHLLQYPYDDYQSIVVVDTAEFFGACRVDPETQLQLAWDDRHHEAHQEWVKEAENEQDYKKIPEGEDVGVVVSAAIPASLGIKNPSAAIRIDLAPKSVGYALKPGDRTYHRPDCSEVDDALDVTYALTPRIPGDSEPWSPCTSCKADKYDDE